MACSPVLVISCLPAWQVLLLTQQSSGGRSLVLHALEVACSAVLVDSLNHPNQDITLE